MLSDEEKEALQYFNTETKTEAMHYGAVLVKLIEKQSKEIEELKAEKDKYYYEWKHLEANMINRIEELEKE